MVVLLSMLVGCGEEESDAPEGSAGGDSGAAAAKVDACGIVTQDDATQLFGQTASPYTGTPALDANMLGQCLWSWDSDTSSHLLQFHVWNGEQYYSTMPDSEPLDFVETGYIRIREVAGVDIAWLRNGKMVSLSYSTIGRDVPKAATKVGQVKQLALKVKADL